MAIKPIVKEFQGEFYSAFFDENGCFEDTSWYIGSDNGGQLYIVLSLLDELIELLNVLKQHTSNS